MQSTCKGTQCVSLHSAKPALYAIPALACVRSKHHATHARDQFPIPNSAVLCFWQFLACELRPGALKLTLGAGIAPRAKQGPLGLLLETPCEGCNAELARVNSHEFATGIRALAKRPFARANSPLLCTRAKQTNPSLFRITVFVGFVLQNLIWVCFSCGCVSVVKQAVVTSPFLAWPLGLLGNCVIANSCALRAKIAQPVLNSHARDVQSNAKGCVPCGIRNSQFHPQGGKFRVQIKPSQNPLRACVRSKHARASRLLLFTHSNAEFAIPRNLLPPFACQGTAKVGAGFARKHFAQEFATVFRGIGACFAHVPCKCEFKPLGEFARGCLGIASHQAQPLCAKVASSCLGIACEASTNSQVQIKSFYALFAPSSALRCFAQCEAMLRTGIRKHAILPC